MRHDPSFLVGRCSHLAMNRLARRIAPTPFNIVHIAIIRETSDPLVVGPHQRDAW
jgi:hypothetical protein